MYVEDKISHRGPFPIQVRPNQTVRELKAQVEKEFEIPVAVQRWILGKELATDDNATLKDVHITTEGCPVFLYLVATSNGECCVTFPKLLKKKRKSVSKQAKKILVKSCLMFHYRIDF